jgi:geranyl-CoA carboxylase alpha subunit
VIEEAPSPAVSPKLRAALGKAAIAAARAVGYTGAGTVEFLVAEDGSYHFLEMNTRLQVEHPVTEMVTGLDLVALQIEIARGKMLPFSQEDLKLDGHAIEARLYAEDPENGFLPATGMLALFAAPQGAGIRIDAGVVSGQTISQHYDPMIAKVIAHGPTREEARRRLVRAFGQTAVFGITSNRDFLLELLESSEFASGEARTSTLATAIGDRSSARPPDASDAGFAGLAVYLARQHEAFAKAPPIAPELLGWSSLGELGARLPLKCGGQVFDCVIGERRGTLTVDSGAGTVRFAFASLAKGMLSGESAGQRFAMPCIASAEGAWLAMPDRIFHFAEPGRSKAEAAGSGPIVAPMHGRIVDVFVEAGQPVEPGARLCMLEAMKMQHAITSAMAGIVRSVAVRAGAQVAAGDVLMEIGDGDA